MKCARCGMETPRLTLTQRYDPKCAAEVAAIVAADTARRTPRFPTSKDMTGAVA